MTKGRIAIRRGASGVKDKPTGIARWGIEVSPMA